MKFSNDLTILAILTISIISLFYFKPIWKDHLIPFPGNLLVSYFSPWKEETWPGYPTGVPRKGLLGFDTLRMMGPWRNFITNEIKSSRFPSWNPHQFGGAPMAANFQSALFFPPNLIYLIFPFHIAWTILVISQPLLAIFGMYLFLRTNPDFSLEKSAGTPEPRTRALATCPTSHERSPGGRAHERRPWEQVSVVWGRQLTIIFLSSMYGFSSWMSAWIEWNIHGFVYALLPWALLFIYRRQTILTILTISIIIFAGHPQMAVIGVTALLIASIVWGKFKWMIAVLLAVMLITSVQWWPAMKYYQQASREQRSSEFVYSKTLLPWSQIPQLIVPNFFGNPATGNFSGKLDFVESTAYSGIAILGFALIGLISSNFLYNPLKIKSSDRDSGLIEKFCLAVLGLITILVFPTPISLMLGRLNIPILSTSVASRWLMLLPLTLTLLSAQGLNNFFTSNKARPYEARPGLYIPATLILIFILSLWIYAFFFPPEFRSVSLRNLIIPTSIAGLFLLTLLFRTADPPASAWSASDWRAGRRRTMQVLLFIMAIFSIGELILFGWKTMPYTEKRFIYPETPVLKKLQEFSRDGSRFAATDGSVIDSNFATYYGLYDLSGYDALYPRRVGELVWTAGNNGNPVKDFSRSTVVVPAKLSESRNNLWNLAGVRWIVNKDDLLPEHPGQKSNELSSDFKLIWEEGKWQIYENTKVYPRAFYISEISPISLIVPAEIIFYQPNKVEISVNAPADGYLVLTDTFYPGWKASVDGSLVKIMPAFGAFRVVQVSKGSHTVRFNL